MILLEKNQSGFVLHQLGSDFLFRLYLRKAVDLCPFQNVPPENCPEETGLGFFFVCVFVFFGFFLLKNSSA